MPESIYYNQPGKQKLNLLLNIFKILTDLKKYRRNHAIIIDIFDED